MRDTGAEGVSLRRTPGSGRPLLGVLTLLGFERANNAVTETTHTLYTQADSTGALSSSSQLSKTISGPLNVCVATPDGYQASGPPNAPVITTNGAVQTRNFASPGAVGWASFAATAGVTYTIRTANLGPSADTVLWLYGSDGTTLLTTNDDYNNTLASQITWQAPGSGTYYIKITNWDPNVGGCGTSYDLSASAAAPPPPPPTFTPTPTASPTATPTGSPTSTGTPSPTTTGTPTETATSTSTATPTATNTPTTEPPIGPVLTFTPTPSPTATSSPTVTPSPTATWTPGPNVAVGVNMTGAGRLAVTISARPENCVPNNQLQELRFSDDPRVYRNALIEIDGQVRQPPFTLSLPPGTVQKSFSVIQVAAGQDATVPLVARDSCGEWNTFVGGGATIFQPIGASANPAAGTTATPTRAPLPTPTRGAATVGSP